MKLSVALCTYNGENFIESQINSIINQSYPIDEIVICDDNSKDNTLKILFDLKKIYDNLIIFQNEKTLGTIKNFEKAISKTSGDLIFLADQDDIWINSKVNKINNFFRENTWCNLVFTNAMLIDDSENQLKNTLWEKWNFNLENQKKWKNNNNAFNDLIFNNNKITGATICFRKELKKYILPIDLPFGYWHDSWLGLNAAATNSLGFINENLIFYRIHQNQQIGLNSNLKKEVILKSNKKFISLDEYFLKISKIYPNKKKVLKSLIKTETNNSTIKSFMIFIKKMFLKK